MSDDRQAIVAPSVRALPRPVALKDGRTAVMRLLVEPDAGQVCAFFPRMHEESDFLNYFPGEWSLTVEQEREFIREHTGRAGAELLCVESDERIVALAGAHPPKFRRDAHHTEIGVAVSREFWGLGLGRALVGQLVGWGAHQGLRKMYLRVFDDNHRAIALYRSLGFVEEGRLKGDVLRADGRYSDSIVMARFFTA
ncbi:MAG: GNAT family N-acetyltransferase [Planctomycetes bacterium]|nr:GNAT family N-acetyltransferase [Planctomycetota bacterium]